MIISYKDLKVWQESIELVLGCYKIAQNLPKIESYGLKSQLQRAAVSIPANIAEGKHRQYVKEFIQHISIAQGSLAEIETYLILIQKLKYEDKSAIDKELSKADKVGKMLRGLVKSLKSRT